MASKINSRLKSEKARSGKPYDRPNQSIFQKVASKVRDYLVPSWWNSATEEENVTIPAPTTSTSDDHNEVTDTAEAMPAPRSSKRPRYDPDVEIVDVIIAPQAGMWPASTTIANELSASVQNNASSQVNPNCELEKKDSQLLVNGDDHSENSEGTGSTSGCSSLISSHIDKPVRSLKLNENNIECLRKSLRGMTERNCNRQRRDAGVSTEDSLKSSTFNRNDGPGDISLWSRDSESSFRNTMRSQYIQSPRPSFNIASFSGSASATGNTSESTSKHSSPFYEGKTMYGGASAYRRAKLSTLPYQSSRALRSNLTVRPNHSTSNSECMSSAAKRILSTLEKMSTPLMDAKKIPNVKRTPADISASFTPASQRFTSYLPLSKRLPISTPSYSKGPPISTVTSASRLSLIKNFSKSSRNSKMEIPVHDRSLSLSNTATSPVPDTETYKGGGGGKIRTRINQHMHQSSKPSDEKEMPEEVILPNIPLPITELPNISFKPKNMSQVSTTAEKQKSATTNDSMSFAFASPIEHLSPNSAKQPCQEKSDASFTFSSPVLQNAATTTSVAVKSTPSKEKVEKKPEEKKETQLYSGSVNDFLKSLRNNDKISDKKISSAKESQNTYKADKELLESVDIVGFGDEFKPPPGSWECTSCLVRNKSGDSRCVSCQSPNPNVAKEVKDTKLDNSATQVKKSNEVKNQTFQGFTQSTAGTWECDTCMVRNTSDKSKCVACETPQFPLGGTDSPSSGFKIGSVAPATTFKFGSFASNSVPTTTTSGFKFGILSETSSNFKSTPVSEAPSGFKFGVSSDTPKLSDSVKFGSTTLPASTSEETKSTTASLPKSTGLFTFGVPSSTETKDPTTVGFGDKFKTAPGSWECASCLVRNKAADDKCVSCQTPNPGAAKDSKDSKSDLTAQPDKPTDEGKNQTFKGFSVPTAGTWECDSCMIRNPLVKTKCMACENPRKSGENTDSKPSDFTASFPAPASTPFKFGSLVSNLVPTTASSSFKFGVAPEATSNFKFAAPPEASSGFKFGALSDPSKHATSVKFGSETLPSSTPEAQKSSTDNVVPKSTGLFAFGVVPPNSSTLPTTSTSEGFKSTTDSLPKSTGVFSFGSTPSTDVKETKNAPFETPSIFKFGASSDTSKQQPIMKFGSETLPASTSEMFKSTTETVPKTTSVFAFGATPTSEVKDSNIGSTAKPLSNTTFGGFTSVPPATTASVPSFNFGVTPSSTAPVTGGFNPSGNNSSGVFTFGAKTTQDAPNVANTAGSLSNPNPVFGTPTTQSVFSNTRTMTSFGKPPEPKQEIQSGFNFGVASKPLNNSTFGGFTPSQPATSTTMPSLNFGMPAPGSTPAAGGFNVASNNPSGGFNFGAKTTQAAPNPVNAAGSMSYPAPLFGSPATQSVFSNTGSITPFGKAPVPKQETQGGFTFGSPAAAPQQGLFRFGGSQEGSQEKRHAPSPAPNAGFNFNMPPQQNVMNFNPSAPPSFNFGATMSTNTPLFQFNANTEPSSSSTSGGRKIRKAVRRGARKND